MELYFEFDFSPCLVFFAGTNFLMMVHALISQPLAAAGGRGPVGEAREAFEVTTITLSWRPSPM